MSDKNRFVVKLDKTQKSIVKRAITLRLAADANLSPDDESVAGDALASIASDYLKAVADSKKS